MKKMVFQAYAITNEINLNKIAEQWGMPKKYTWEEPLVLNERILKSILDNTISSDSEIMVFSFGSIVFINFDFNYIEAFIRYLKDFEEDLEIKMWNRYSDNYEIRLDASKDIIFTDEYVTVPTLELYYSELISTVIAKSVALEKTEEQLGKILDKLESMIDRLEKGKMHVGNKQLARTTAAIVRHEYNTIAYIMILDRPDITWANSSAAQFYDQMSEFFELNDRYEIVKKKSEILNNILEGFSSISHSIRGLFVEWVIVILIVMEVILMILDLLK